MNAKKNVLMYCREYNALVIVRKDHRDIFREIPIGEVFGNISWTNGENIIEIRDG